MKYIAYCRKSREEKDKQILSISAQIAELKEYAKKEHLEISEFVEEEKTAKTPGRGKFTEVLKNALVWKGKDKKILKKFEKR